jgi:hypothetical protein
MSRPTVELVDPVADDMPGAREIGFSVPRRYNASRIRRGRFRQRKGDERRPVSDG